MKRYRMVRGEIYNDLFEVEANSAEEARALLEGEDGGELLVKRLDTFGDPTNPADWPSTAYEVLSVDGETNEECDNAKPHPFLAFVRDVASMEPTALPNSADACMALMQVTERARELVRHWCGEDALSKRTEEDAPTDQDEEGKLEENLGNWMAVDEIMQGRAQSDWMLVTSIDGAEPQGLDEAFVKDAPGEPLTLRRAYQGFWDRLGRGRDWEEVLESPTLADVLAACNRSIHTTGDDHHVFLESVAVERDPDGRLVATPVFGS